MSGPKQYGLQVPKKGNQGLLKKHAIFENDTDSNSDGDGDWVKKSLKLAAEKGLKRQTKIDMQRALDQDSTIYQYDEIYDQLEKKKEEAQPKVERKAKYIHKLIETSERRKREHERRIERQVQKEREAEGEMYKDKETFVTSAYKKKLEEFAQLDEEQRKQDLLEDIGDVTKQQDISGFYRHLYQETVTKEDKPIVKPDLGKYESSTNDDKTSSGRVYRTRQNSNSSEEDTKDAADADTSISSDSSSSDSEKSEPVSKKPKVEPEPKPEPRVEPKEEEKPEEPVVEKAKPKGPDRSIWVKRTVGPVFEAALQRYYERKAARALAY